MKTPIIKTQVMWILTFCLLALAGATVAECVVFDATFTGPQGTQVDPVVWRVLGPNPNAPAPVLDGNGSLVMEGVDGWNDPAIETLGVALGKRRFFISAIPPVNNYRVDFVVRVPDVGPHFLGLRSDSISQGFLPAENRSFYLNSDGNIHIGENQGAALEDTGVQYPLNQFFTLRMDLNGNGQAAYSVNTGSGFVNLNAGHLSTWNTTEDIRYTLKVDANGSAATDKKLLIDRITVTDLTASNCSPTPTPTPTPTPVATPPAGAKNALFVVDTAAADTSGDAAIQARLAALGYTVMVVDDAASQPSDAAQKNVIVISSTVNPDLVLDKYAWFSVPVITWETGIWDDMWMTVSSFPFSGSLADQTELVITNPTHPLAAGRTGTISTSGNPDTYRWNNPRAEATGAIRIASLVGTPERSAILAYDVGGLMEAGFVAPGRRVGFFLGDAASGASLSADGGALFDAAINWLVSSVTATPVPTASATASPTATGKPNGIGQSWYLYE